MTVHEIGDRTYVVDACTNGGYLHAGHLWKPQGETPRWCPGRTAVFGATVPVPAVPVVAPVAGGGGESELRDWWAKVTQDEIDAMAPKAAEYGSNSLTDVGHQIARTAGRTISDEEAGELGCYFYIVGKMGRWADAVARGERVSDDTLHDIGVYTRMAQRIRAVGGWPFAPGAETSED